MNFTFPNFHNVLIFWSTFMVDKSNNFSRFELSEKACNANEINIVWLGKHLKNCFYVFINS